MKRLMVACACFSLIAATASPAHSQMAKSDCVSLREPIALASAQMASFLANFEKSHFVGLGSKAGNGTEKQAYDKLLTAHQEALPALRNYVTALQDFSYAMQVCARP